MALTKISTAMISQSAAAVDLNVDAGTFYVDTTNNRVGVGGKTDPDTPLHVIGTVTATTFAGSGASLTSIPNSALVNSSITINSTAVSLGGSLTLTTANIAENTNLYYTNARADARIAAADTDDLSEGSSNLYYTDARVDARVSGGSLGNITTTGYIRGPATFTIDPAAHGDNTGTVVIAGNLQVDGTQTVINSTTMTVDDKNITLASGSLNAGAADGAGFTVDIGTGTNPAITYDGTNDEWAFNKKLNVKQDVDSFIMKVENDGNSAGTSGASYADASDGLWVDTRWNTSSNTPFKVTSNSGTAPMMIIKGNGNVGIGTATPSHTLHTSTSATGVYIQRELTSNAANLSEFNSHRSLIIKNRASGSFLMFGGNGARTDIQATDGAGTPTAKNIALNPFGGNVGIGETAPLGKLHIKSADAGSITPNSSHEDLIIEGSGNTGINIFSGTSSYQYLAFGDSGGSNRGYVRYHHGSDQMVLRAGGTDTVHINGNGNVGIGETSPGSKLHIKDATNISASAQGAGQFRVEGSGYTTSIAMDATRAHIYHNSSLRNLSFGTNESIDMTIKGSNGNVGIGTTNPASNLHIKTSVDNSVAQGLVIERSANTDRGYINYNGGGFQFRSTVGDPIVFGETDAEHMRILPDGNVGIGTSSPNATLSLSDGTDVFDFGVTANLLMIKSVTADGSDDHRIILDAGNGGTSSTRGAFIALSGNESTSEAGKAIYQMGNVTTASHVFRKAGGIDAVTIDRDGQVGIGAVSPGYKLEISDDTNSTVNLLRLRNADGTYSQTWDFQLNTSKHLEITGASGSGGIVLNPGSTGTTANNGLYVTGNSTLQTAVAKITRVQASASNNTYTFEVDSSAHTSNMTSGGAMKVDVNSGRAFTINGSGNVGIGTASPSTKLHIKGTNSSRNTIVSNLTLDGGTSAANPYDGFGFGINFIGRDYGNAIRNYAHIYSVIEGQTSNSGGGDAGFKSLLSFYTNSGGASGTNPTEKMRITSAGKVGIGTDNPSGLLSLKSGTYCDVEFFSHPDGGTVQTFNRTSASYGYLRFLTKTGSAGSETMRLTPDGNVGIGTDSPGHLLDILKSGSGDATVNIKSTTGGDPTLIFNSAAANRNGLIKYQDNGTNVGRIDYVHNGDRIDIQAGSATGATMSIKNGAVGIGTDTPDAILEINAPSSGHDSSARVATITAPVYPSLEFYSTNTNTNNRNWKIASVYNAYGTLEFLQSSAANGAPNQTVMSMDKVGNVGIGTTDNGGRLTIQTADATTNSAVNSLMIRNLSSGTTTTGFGGEIRFQAQRNNGVNQNTGGIRSIAEVNSGSNISSGMAFDTSTAGVNNEALRITYDGDVLIGTSTNLNVLSGTPKLQIGSGTGHASLQFYSGTTSVNGIYFGDTSNANTDRYRGYIEYRHNDDTMAFRANGASVLTLDSNGLMQGSLSRYTNSSNVNVIMEDAHESAATIGSSWTTLTYWIASQSGELRTTLGLYISSGSYYFNYRFFNATKNTVVKMSNNSTDASHFYTANRTSNEGNVHHWQYYQLDLGVIDAGDEIKIQMQAANGAGVAAAGNGQTGYVKQWRFLSGKQVPVERDNGVMERPTVRGVMRQSQLQNGTGPVTHTIPIFLGSGTHDIFSILTGFDQGSMAVASIRYVGLYAYAANNSALGDQQATIRRGTGNTVWQTGAKTVHFETNGGSLSTPSFAWTTGGVLQMILAGSHQIVGEVTITTHSIPGYKYGVNV